MIRALRVRHRITFAVLALALPLGLAAALSSRQQVPRLNAHHNGNVAQPDMHASVRDSIVGFDGIVLSLRTWNENGLRTLEIRPQRDLEQPDVLVYWADSTKTSGLPEPSVLLGALAGTQPRRFTLPREVHGGRLYLYSLGHQELIGSLEFEP